VRNAADEVLYRRPQTSIQDGYPQTSIQTSSAAHDSDQTREEDGGAEDEQDETDATGADAVRAGEASPARGDQAQRDEACADEHHAGEECVIDQEMPGREEGRVRTRTVGVRPFDEHGDRRRSESHGRAEAATDEAPRSIVLGAAALARADRRLAHTSSLSPTSRVPRGDLPARPGHALLRLIAQRLNDLVEVHDG